MISYAVVGVSLLSVGLLDAALQPSPVAQTTSCPAYERGIRVRALLHPDIAPLPGVLTVVAIAGDDVLVQDNVMFVNGSALPDAIRGALDAPGVQWRLLVPECMTVVLHDSKFPSPRNYGPLPAKVLEPFEPATHLQPPVSQAIDVASAIHFGETRAVWRILTLGAARVASEMPALVTMGAYSTPFLRVAMRARRAKAQGGRLLPRDVKAEWLAPELHVYVCPRGYNGRSAPPLRVYLRPSNGTLAEKSKAMIAASQLEPLSPEDHRLFFDFIAHDGEYGHQQMSLDHGLRAVFPLSAFAEDLEVYVEYLEPIPLCRECGAPLVGRRKLQ